MNWFKDDLLMYISLFFFIFYGCSDKKTSCFGTKQENGDACYMLQKQIEWINSCNQEGSVKEEGHGSGGCLTQKVDSGLIYNYDTKQPIITSSITERIRLACKTPEQSFNALNGNYEWYRSEVSNPPPGYELKRIIFDINHMGIFDTYYNNDILYCIQTFQFQKLIVNIR